MKKVLFFVILISLTGCQSTLKLNLKSESGEEVMDYERKGFGTESPYEVALAAQMLVQAEAMREAIKKDPRNIVLFQIWYGGYVGYTDPCYYYPVGLCPPEVQKQVIDSSASGGSKEGGK